MKPGQPTRVDFQYERNGTANLFMLFAPLEGWRHVKVTDRRTALEYAQVLKDLSDVHFPAAKRIILVQDNLNTHAKSSLYAALHPETRLLARYGGNRTRHLDDAMSGPPHSRQTYPRNRGRRMGENAKYRQYTLLT